MSAARTALEPSPRGEAAAIGWQGNQPSGRERMSLGQSWNTVRNILFLFTYQMILRLCLMARRLNY